MEGDVEKGSLEGYGALFDTRHNSQQHSYELLINRRNTFPARRYALGLAVVVASTLAVSLLLRTNQDSYAYRAESQASSSIFRNISLKTSLIVGNITSPTNKSALRDSTWDVNWGLKNPVTGVDRVSCDDSVGWGSWGSTDEKAIHRFYGNVGQTYTVECPDGCDNAGPVWGCGTFLDDSSICKAAIAMGMATKKTSSVVSFQLVEPIAIYPECKKNSVQTISWTWYEWSKASRADKIKSYCPSDWLTTHTIDQPCEAALRKYRWDCKINNQIEHCFGVRAFQFVKASTLPTINPPSGQFVGVVQVTVQIPPLEKFICTTDGSDPKITDVPFDNLVSGQTSFQLKQEGKNVVKCQGIESGCVPSTMIVREYDILTKLPGPLFDPDGGLFVEEALVTISCTVANVVIKYYFDATEPSTATLYSGPIKIRKSGTKVYAYATGHPVLKDSQVSVSNAFLIQARSPIITLPVAVQTGFAVVNVTVQRAEEKAFCTSDGTMPTVLSDRCDRHFTVMQNHARVKAIAVGNDLIPSNTSISDMIIVRSYAPVFNPDGGTFEDMAEVTLDYPGPGSYKMYFTLSGGNPNAQSTEYTAAISISETGKVVKAIAISGDLEPSSIAASKTFVILSKRPTFQPPAGLFVDQVTIMISCSDPNAAIYFTLDGNNPTQNSERYKSPILIANDGTYLRAIAKSSKKDPSAMIEARYSIKTATPELSGSEGTHETVAVVTVTCTSQNARIYFTLDGSVPNEFSQRAKNNQIEVTSSGTKVKVIAISERKQASDVVSTPSIRIETASPTFFPNGGEFVDVASVT
eukprot:464672-Hanusia_phi.AAC.1